MQMTNIRMPDVSVERTQAGQMVADRSIRYQPKWSRRKLDAATVMGGLLLDFFTDGHDGNTTTADTNVATGGRLDESQDFVAEGVSVQAFSKDGDDIALIAQGVLCLELTRNTQLELPVYLCGGGGGIYAAGSDSSTAIYQLGAPQSMGGFWFPSDPRNRRSPYAYKIDGGEEFKAIIKWNGLVTGTLNEDTVIWVNIYGHTKFDQDS